MKNRNLLLIPLLTICCGLSAEIWIVDAQTPVKAIVYDGEKRSQEEKHVSEELAEYIKAMTGKELPVYSEMKKFNSADSFIIIGENSLSKSIGLDCGELNSEGFYKLTKNGNLYLLGSSAKGQKGVSFAVYDFLESECDVRWLWPGELGTVIPRKDRITIPPLNVKGAPALQIRDVILEYSNYHTRQENSEFREWKLHHKMGRSLGGEFSHSFWRYIPPKEYGKEHPEYFGLVSPQNWIGTGKPNQPTRYVNLSSKDDWQLCTANPDVRKLIVEKILEKNSDNIQSVSPNDGYGFCECEQCRALDIDKNWSDCFTFPNLSDRIYDFANNIAKEVKTKQADAKIGVFSYTFFHRPPEKIKQFEDNVYISITFIGSAHRNPQSWSDFHQKVAGFGQKGAKIVGRDYWGIFYFLNLPWLHTKEIDRSLKLLAENGAAGIYGSMSKDWANNALNYYVLGKLMWNPEANLDDIITDFCQSGFGESALEMKQYYDFLEKKIDDWFAARVKNNLPTTGYPNWLNNYHQIFTPEVLQDANQRLNRAESQTTSSLIKQRIAYVRSGIKYTEIMMKLIPAYQKAAALGVNLPFIEPDPAFTVLTDQQILSCLDEAIKWGNAREIFLVSNHGNHAVDLSVLLSGNRMELRPWHWLAQDAKGAFRKGVFNFLINGDFERDMYGWDIKENSGKPQIKLDFGTNHDDYNNILAQYHGKQGKSLYIKLKSGDSCQVLSGRPIPVTGKGMLKLSGWIKPSNIEGFNIGIDWYAAPDLNKEKFLSSSMLKLSDFKEGEWQNVMVECFPPDKDLAYGRVRLEPIKKTPTQEGEIWMDNFKVNRSKGGNQ